MIWVLLVFFVVLVGVQVSVFRAMRLLGDRVDDLAGRLESAPKPVIPPVIPDVGKATVTRYNSRKWAEREDLENMRKGGALLVDELRGLISG